MLFLGSWLSGYFIIVTNAFMQHPVGHAVGADGALQLADFWAYLFNPWAFWQYAHTMSAAVDHRRRSWWPRSARTGR